VKSLLCYFTGQFSAFPISDLYKVKTHPPRPVKSALAREMEFRISQAEARGMRSIFHRAASLGCFTGQFSALQISDF
jgi:hypothetical protein